MIENLRALFGHTVAATTENVGFGLQFAEFTQQSRGVQIARSFSGYD
jgi:hypothetical protein